MTTAAEIEHLKAHGLYSTAHEHDACGLGFVAHIKGVKRHDIVTQALKILENIDHRGAVGADKLMGDGAGILIQIPDQLYREEMAKQGVVLPPAGEYGVGMVFLPKEHASRLACEQELERAIKAEGQVLLGWRDVPVNREMPMSPTVRTKEPILRQLFIGRGSDVIVQDALERKLYVIRKTASAAIQALKLKHSKEYYVPSMSSRTVVYKGLLLADQVGQYYLDLQDERCVSGVGLVQQRFSTNSFPEWPLAHPYRYVAHNGEINTVKGNYNWMKAREGVMSSPALDPGLSRAQALLYRTMLALAPDLPVPSGLKPERLSHDPEVARRWHADPLVHGRITARLLRFVVEGSSRALREAPRLAVPALLQYGTDDSFVDPAGSRRFAAASPADRLTVHEYRGLRHELHQEPEPMREQVRADLAAWLARVA